MPTLQTTLREGNVRLRVKKDGSLTNEQDYHFRIKADSLTQSREEILLNTPGTPKFGVPYGAFGMMLKGCDGNRLDEDALLWDCVFNLSNQVEEGENSGPDGQPQIGDPTEWIPVIELGFEDYEEVFQRSLNATADEVDSDQTVGGVDGTETPGTGYNARNWTNSAGQPYESGFVRQMRIITRQFTQFEPLDGPRAVTLDQIEARNDTLNKTEFAGKPKRTLKLSVNGVAAGFYYGMRCWRVDYVMAYKKTDWRLKKLDVGWYYIDSGDSNKKKKFLDDDDPPSNIVGALNGKGDKATNQFEPFVRAHKEFESIEFADFIRFS